MVKKSIAARLDRPGDFRFLPPGQTNRPAGQDMNWISNFLSFEKPMGEMLTRLLFYLFSIFILWRGLEALFYYIALLDDDWDSALWGVLKTPVIVIVQLLVLRVIAEFVMSVLRLDKTNA